jgi:fermentation-respiration switch protein FrsA (DUF1100 family)
MAKANPFVTCCWLTLLVLLISLIVSMVSLYFGQDQLIYQNDFPSPYEEYPEENQEGKRNPGEKNMLFEDIGVKTSDGLRLAGWFMHHGNDTRIHPTIIFMGESVGNIGKKLAWAENIYFNLGVNIVLVGYRGYGHSEGSPSEYGLEIDSKAIIKWTLENPKINKDQVYVYGKILGGAVATYGVQDYQDKVKGLMLENTFQNMATAIDDTNWLFRLLRPVILANYWPTDERIKTTRLPILFISGTESNTHDDMDRLRDMATNSSLVEFLNVPNGTKINTWRVGGKPYLLAIDEFIIKTRTGITKIPIPVPVKKQNNATSA